MDLLSQIEGGRRRLSSKAWEGIVIGSCVHCTTRLEVGDKRLKGEAEERKRREEERMAGVLAKLGMKI